MDNELTFSWEGRDYKAKHVEYDDESRWTVIENLCDGQQVVKHEGWLDKSVIRTIVEAYDKGVGFGKMRGRSSAKAEIRQALDV